MRYVLIKKCRIVGVQDRNVDILIANNKIVAIGKNISRPTIDCEDVEAGGRLVVPGFVDICSQFSSTVHNENLTGKVYEDLSGGFTTWIGDVAPSDVAEKLEQLSHQDPHTLNYSLHYNINAFHHGDLNKIKNTSDLNGIPTLHYLVDSAKAAFNDRLDLYLATAAKNDMLMIFEIAIPTNVDEHLRALNHLCAKIDGMGCRVLFVNVRFKEEFDIIARSRQKNDTFVHLLYHALPLGVPGLTEISHMEFVELLRQNIWISGDVADLKTDSGGAYNIEGRENFSRKHRVAILGALCQEEHLTTEEMVEYVTERKCKLVGLWPEKGRVEVGADADLCVVNDNVKSVVTIHDGDFEKTLELNGSVDVVIMSGRVVYENGDMKLNNIYGQQAFRRFV